MVEVNKGNEENKSKGGGNIKMEVLRPDGHKHGKKLYAKGEVIPNLRKDQAERLANRKIAKPV